MGPFCYPLIVFYSVYTPLSIPLRGILASKPLFWLFLWPGNLGDPLVQAGSQEADAEVEITGRNFVRSALGITACEGIKEGLQGRGRSWVLRQLQPRPGWSCKGALGLGWPLGVDPSWEKGASLYVPASARHWVWAAFRMGAWSWARQFSAAMSNPHRGSQMSRLCSQQQGARSAAQLGEGLGSAMGPVAWQCPLHCAGHAFLSVTRVHTAVCILQMSEELSVSAVGSIILTLLLACFMGFFPYLDCKAPKKFYISFVSLAGLKWSIINNMCSRKGKEFGAWTPNCKSQNCYLQIYKIIHII